MGGARGRLPEPALMFQSIFKKLIVLIPNVLRELFLFALYLFSVEETRKRQWKQMNLDRGISVPCNLTHKSDP